jgi:hypothetical protein
MTRECFINSSVENQLYGILEALSATSGYVIPTRECFNAMTLDYQLYHIWQAWL